MYLVNRFAQDCDIVYWEKIFLVQCAYLCIVLLADMVEQEGGAADLCLDF
jgi:hypothetical protein